NETGVYPMQDKSIFELSGGERQRAWIAMALAQKPKILFLDEPTTYLDISYQLEVMRLVRRLNDKHGMTVLMVLHDLSQAMTYSDYLVVMKSGKKYAEGRPKDLMSPELMKEVYNVDCEIVHVPGYPCPFLSFEARQQACCQNKHLSTKESKQ
ncbi:MAG: ABC transporter ATP-binding protein, partial [Eubacteriales bacterium]|nr:ABC transporter ATP-binding protein [Eubacteriales bacterium]